MDTKQRREITEALKDYKDLMEHRGWKRLVEIAKAQQHERSQRVILTPLESQDQALAQEFMKGEFAGIGVLLAIPQTEVDLYDELLNEADKEEDEDADHSDKA